MGRRRLGILVLLMLGLPGCRRAPAPPPATGAREVVRAFYEGLLAEDWPRSYALLHPESQDWCKPEPFAARGRAYRKGIGFAADEARIRACEEQGEQAVAHVVLGVR